MRMYEDGSAGCDWNLELASAEGPVCKGCDPQRGKALLYEDLKRGGYEGRGATRVQHVKRPHHHQLTEDLGEEL